MATLTTALNAEFTPAVGDFIASATGQVTLDRKNAAGAAWAVVGPITAAAVIVSNPVAGAVYRFTVVAGTPAVQADQ